MKFKLIFDDSVQFKLPNGLYVELIYAPIHQTYVQYDIPLGSIHTHYKINDTIYELKPGIAHFLEHMMYMMPDHDAFEHFHQLGVVANAMTTYRQTTYDIIGHQHMLEATLYLIDMLETPVFTSKRVQQERAIIQEEIAMYDDELDTIIQKKMFDQLLIHHPLKSQITGHKKDIAKIKKEDLNVAYDHFYRADNRQLLIMGPIDVEAFEKALKSYPYKIKSPTMPMMMPHQEPLMIKQSEVFYHIPIEVSVLNVGLKLNIDNINESHLFKTEVTMLFLMRLLFGTTSNFHDQMIQNNLMIDGFNLNVTLEDQTLIFMMDVESNDTISLKKHVEQHLLYGFENEIDASTFSDLKKAYIGHFMMALDDIQNRLFIYGKYRQYNFSLFDAYNILESITLKDILELKTHIKPQLISYSHFITKD